MYEIVKVTCAQYDAGPGWIGQCAGQDGGKLHGRHDVQLLQHGHDSHCVLHGVHRDPHGGLHDGDHQDRRLEWERAVGASAC